MKLNEITDLRSNVWAWLEKYDFGSHNPNDEERLNLTDDVLVKSQLLLSPKKNGQRFVAPIVQVVSDHKIQMSGYDPSTIKLEWIKYTKDLQLSSEGDWTKSTPGIIQEVTRINPKEFALWTSIHSTINLMSFFDLTCTVEIQIFNEGYGNVGGAKSLIQFNHFRGIKELWFWDADNSDHDVIEVKDQFEAQDILIERGYGRFV